MSLLEVRNLKKSYQMGQQKIDVLNEIDLNIEAGEFVAIMGPSGSGKSTLMHLLGLLDAPSDGSYKINNVEVSQMSEDELSSLRRTVIGFIFQQFHLLPKMSAVENVSMPLMYSQGKMSLDEGFKLLAQVGLSERSSHRPNELSGGQQQRVAIARSLINKPKIIFADEPTGNLDSRSEQEIMKILKGLHQQGYTIIIVTHEEEIGKQANRIIRMRDGKIIADEKMYKNKDFVNHDESRSESRSESKINDESIKTSIEQYTKYLIFQQNKKSFFISWVQLKLHFSQSLKTLLASKVRTALSILGILIGVASVVTMLALGAGAQNAMEKQLASLGSNLLMIRPGAVRSSGGVMLDVGSATRLKLEDALAIKDKIPGVKESSAIVNGKGQVTFQNKNWSTTVSGTTEQYARMHSLVPSLGRFFSDEENQQRSLVAVIGLTVSRELFGTANPLGEIVKINKKNFVVIGVLPERGASGFGDRDDVIIIPLLTAMHRLMGKLYVDMIEVEAIDSQSTGNVQNEVTDLLLARHKIPASQGDDAFSVRNMQDIQDALSSTTKIMTLLLSVIAAISLVVGGIGIMNIMLVSVTERTKEIGLRKAVGALRSDILWQFLIESITVSVMGGVFGIILGWTTTAVLSAISGWSTSITLGSILLSFIFSVSIGIIFGIYPARKASILHPIEALRFD